MMASTTRLASHSSRSDDPLAPPAACQEVSAARELVGFRQQRHRISHLAEVREAAKERALVVPRAALNGGNLSLSGD